MLRYSILKGTLCSIGALTGLGNLHSFKKACPESDREEIEGISTLIHENKKLIVCRSAETQKSSGRFPLIPGLYLIK